MVNRLGRGKTAGLEDITFKTRQDKAWALRDDSIRKHTPASVPVHFLFLLTHASIP